MRAAHRKTVGRESGWGSSTSSGTSESLSEESIDSGGPGVKNCRELGSRT